MLKILKIALIVLLVLVIVVFAVVLPIVSISVYKSVFDVRFETAVDEYFTADDYDGLNVENVSFRTKQGHTLAGYKYRMEDVTGRRCLGARFRRRRALHLSADDPLFCTARICGLRV